MKDEEREVKIDQKERSRNIVPWACHACGFLMYNWDKTPFYRYGVCSDCSINYVEDRDLPENLIRDRDKLIEYVKEKVAEKKEKIKELDKKE